LAPAPDTRPVGLPCGGGDVVHTVAEPWPQGKDPQALALACLGEQRVDP
jgi:hypothetical protein